MDNMNRVPWRNSSYSGNNGGNCVEVATWRKSSFSGNNGTDCVEVATWRKATYSANNGTDCVEAGATARGHILIRDTTNRDGTVLDLPADAWERFTASFK
jgi:Domain of unknown function (DUF397)